MTRPRLILVASLVLGLAACGAYGHPDTGGQTDGGGSVTDGGGSVTDGGGSVTDGGGNVTDGGGGGTDGGGGGTDGGGGGTGGGWCGPAAPPSAPNLCCSSCTPGSGNCQANGCYNGWWCNTSTCACEAPPTTCGGGTDGGTGGGTDGGTGGGVGLRVLFDDAHAEQAGSADWIVDSTMPIPSPSNPTTGTDWSGAYSSFGVALTLDGDTVETLPPNHALTYGSGGTQDLSRFQVLVLPEPNDTLSASEIRAINAFVRAGGGLVAISDHGGADRNHSGADAVQILNQLFASDSYGVHLDGSDVSGTVNVSGSDPLATGPYGSVSRLAVFNGSTMTLAAATNPSVRQVGTLSGGTFDAAGSLGAGRFVVHGDSSTADDGSATNWNKPNYDAWDQSGYQDAAFFQNAVAWVAGAY